MAVCTVQAYLGEACIWTRAIERTLMWHDRILTLWLHVALLLTRLRVAGGGWLWPSLPLFLRRWRCRVGRRLDRRLLES